VVGVKEDVILKNDIFVVKSIKVPGSLTQNGRQGKEDFGKCPDSPQTLARRRKPKSFWKVAVLLVTQSI